MVRGSELPDPGGAAMTVFPVGAPPVPCGQEAFPPPTATPPGGAYALSPAFGADSELHRAARG